MPLTQRKPSAWLLHWFDWADQIPGPRPLRRALVRELARADAGARSPFCDRLATLAQDRVSYIARL